MIYLKENPVGVDKEIQSVQQRLYDALGYADLDAYGRVYLTERSGKTIPEYYTCVTNEYKEVLVDDSKLGGFFFTEEPSTEIVKHFFTTKVHLIFWLDLSRVKPLISHRADEEMRIEIYSKLKSIVTREDVEVVKGIEALKGIDTKLIDMQPCHFIRYSFNLRYNIKC